MSKAAVLDASRPKFDQVMQDIADYVYDYDVSQSSKAMEIARYDWMDTIGCGLFALDYPACTKLLGPIVPGADMPGIGARVPGTTLELDPVRAAWNIGAMIRWLDYNDTWLAAEWGHPSDNLGAILALADYLSRKSVATGGPSLQMRDVLIAMIQAHEIQGVLALENSFNRVGLCHVLLVRIASTAVTAKMLGCTHAECLNAISQAWVDGSSLRTYRHAPNTGSRKSWAAGDACARGLFLALTALRGEMGYPSAITAPNWGFQDASFNKQSLQFSRGYGSYTMENILFKISFPAEFHAQTAVEAAVILHPKIVHRVDQVQRIVIKTQESGDRIINKTGALDNPADRDHCLQYMVAVGLLKGDLQAQDYEDDTASEPRIDALRKTMEVFEEARFSREYLEADKRAIGNSVQVFFKDGTSTEEVSIDYPVGHSRRRDEAIPLLKAKFDRALSGRLSAKKTAAIHHICAEQELFETTRVTDMMALLQQ